MSAWPPVQQLLVIRPKRTPPGLWPSQVFRHEGYSPPRPFCFAAQERLAWPTSALWVQAHHVRSCQRYRNLKNSLKKSKKDKLDFVQNQQAVARRPVQHLVYGLTAKCEPDSLFKGCTGHPPCFSDRGFSRTVRGSKKGNPTR